MELMDRSENLGGNGFGYASSGGIGLFLMAIFLIVLFSLFCRGRDGHCGECREGCADKLTWARYANYIDPEMSRNHYDQAKDTGRILHEQTKDTGQILLEQAKEAGAMRCALDKQTGELLLNQERTAHNITLGQAAIAREQERMFLQAELNRKDEKLAEQRERAIMLEGRLMQAESERAADRRQNELFYAMNHQNFAFARQLDSIQCQMVKAPQFLPYGGIQSVNLCGYNPCGGTYTHNGCGSCA